MPQPSEDVEFPLVHTPLDVANTFIDRFAGEQGIEHMKLQKLVYFTHGWWLAINGDSLLDERPQVWRHGPVFETLYHTLKTFGHQPIRRPQSRSPNEAPGMIADSNVVPGYIDFVWNRYGALSSFALSDMTHKPGDSWSRLAAEYDYQVPAGLEIPDDYVRSDFLTAYHEEFGRSGQMASA